MMMPTALGLALGASASVSMLFPRRLAPPGGLTSPAWAPRKRQPIRAFSKRCAAVARGARRFLASRINRNARARPVNVLTHPSQSAQSVEGLLEPSVTSIEEINSEIVQLKSLLLSLRTCSTVAQKISVITALPAFKECISQNRSLAKVLAKAANLSEEKQFVLKCLVAIGQQHALELTETGRELTWALDELATGLLRVEGFYDSMGGIVGYQLKSLQLIKEGTESALGQGLAQETQPTTQIQYHVPPALDLAGEEGRTLGTRATLEGILALPHSAEVYPVGGAGDRLGLKCDISGECLPAAMLPYCGRTMMEGLIRDLQGREYLYWKLTGKQLEVPVVVMTSDAKGNHRRMTQLLEALEWMGRSRDSFRLFRQPLVPVLSAEDGQWLLDGQLQLMMKPGGHGAIWKLMWDEGIFSWLGARRCTSAIVRQISNPMAGMDTTLLALLGTGYSQGKVFGFMACERAVGAAEGMNVLQERKTWVSDGCGNGHWEYTYGVTNIEYTEFEKLGITDCAVCEGSSHSVFPANTNVLYVNVQAAEAAVRQAVEAGGDGMLPGLIFNLQKKVNYKDPLTGHERQVRAGRMETTMQNLADTLADTLEEPLASSAEAEKLRTFMVYNLRRKVTSSAKKKRQAGSRKIAQTPDGSFFDLMRNAWHVLQLCGMTHVPEIGSVDDYLANGPSFIFLFNPALGPLWDVIAQKVRGGCLLGRSELVLEVAEACVQEVVVEGSLLVQADAVMGHTTTRPWREANNVMAFRLTDLDGGASVPAGARRAADATQASRGAPSTNGNTNGTRHSARDADSLVPLGSHAHANGNANGNGSAKPQGSRLVYSEQCGRVRMVNVRVQNRGIDWQHPGNQYWRHSVRRHEAARVLLRGRSEFDAEDVTISGDATFEVPDGYKMVLRPGLGGKPNVTLSRLPTELPSWQWEYFADAVGNVHLRFQQQSFAMDLPAYLLPLPSGSVLPKLAHEFEFII